MDDTAKSRDCHHKRILFVYISHTENNRLIGQPHPDGINLLHKDRLFRADFISVIHM